MPDPIWNAFILILHSATEVGRQRHGKCTSDSSLTIS